MFALFVYMIITIALKDFSPGYILPMSILVACLAGYDGTLGAYLSLSRIIVFYPFFYAGYALDPKKIEEHCKKPLAKAAAVIILVGFVTGVVLFGEEYYSVRPLLTGVNPFSTLGDYAKYGFLLRIAAYAAAALSGYAFIVLTPQSTPFGIAAKYGRRTLPVYALHYICIYLLFYTFEIREVLQKVSPVWDEWLAMLLAIPIIFVCSLGVFDKLFSKISVIPLKK
jgi:fucose 4-O-acetylase-like acetyltransferase